MRLFERASYILLSCIFLYIVIFVFIPNSTLRRQFIDRNRILFQVNTLTTTKTHVYKLNSTMANHYGIKVLPKIRPDINIRKGKGMTTSQKERSRMVSKEQNQCTNPPPNLKGREKVVKDISYDFNYLEKMFSDSAEGGHFTPKKCQPYIKIALIIPFRDRDLHLKQFLLNMIPKLKRQQLDFTIYVTEQAPGSHFNRGLMRNIGFTEASKIDDYDCYIFNDVDTILEDDRNIYKCGKGDKVRHLMAAADRFKYRLMYPSLVGGVIAFTKEQFHRVNGYANQYFVWGSEDDDLARRIQLKNMTIERPSEVIGVYTTLRHSHQPRDNLTDDIYNSMKKYADKDGLNSLSYEVVLKEFRKLYTWLYLKVDEEKIKRNVNFSFYVPNAQRTT